ncbi:MAG: GNAT family N-acetyltransferase [Psychrobium sp.]|nr:GNAT family N-acetyltransferase [Psychrobium sp.]
MKDILINAASVDDYQAVSALVQKLYHELDPVAAKELDGAAIDLLTKDLLSTQTIWAYIARHGGKNVGVITLHQCAAIYAGGVFGEISELYVDPDFRSTSVGESLVNVVVEKATQLNWKRLEVGSPPPDKSPRTIEFYENKGFKFLGARFRRLM